MQTLLGLLIATLFVSLPCQATVQAGTGLSSVTSGRMIPGLEAGFGGDNWLISGSATGVRNAYYYHSAYTLSYFRTWQSGDLFWAEVHSGIGGGVMYAKRGFADEGAEEETAEDFAVGPAFFVRWDLVKPVYLKLDMIWGIREVAPNLTLTGQDVIFFSVGASGW